MKKSAILLLSGLVLYSCGGSSLSQKTTLSENSWNDLKDNDLSGPVKSVAYFMPKDSNDLLNPNNEDTFCFRKMEFDSNGGLYRLSRFGFGEGNSDEVKESIYRYYFEYKDAYLIRSGDKDKQGKDCDFKTFTYSDEGILNRVDYSYCKPHDRLLRRVFFYFNDRKELIEKRLIYESKEGPDTTYLKYKDGVLVAGINPKQVNYRHENILRDSLGRVSQFEVVYYYKDKIRDKRLSRWTQFDAYGNWLYHEFIDISDIPERKHVTTRKFEYYE